MELLKRHHEKLVTGIALLLLPLMLFNAPGTHDVWMWMGWLAPIEPHGVVEGYRISNSWYPPLFFVLAGSLSPFEHLLGMDGFYVFKLSLLAGSLATCWIAWRWTRNSTTTLMIYLVLVFCCIYMVYVDGWVIPFVLGALYCLVHHDYRRFSVLYALACFIKWQPLILAPALAVYVLRTGLDQKLDRRGWMQLLWQTIAPGALITLAILTVFGFREVMNNLTVALNEGFFSALALNASWIITHVLHTLSPETYGALQHNRNDFIIGDPGWPATTLKVSLLLVFVITLGVFLRRKANAENLLLSLVTVYFAYYILNTGVHENHLFIAAVLALVLAGLHERYLSLALVLNLINIINLLLFYPFYEDVLKRGSLVFHTDIGLVMAVFNTLFFFYFWIRVLRNNAS